MLQQRLELITAPTEEPITLVEAKLHLRVDITADDTLISSAIAAARAWVEEYTGRALVSQTWLLTMDEFPPGCWTPPAGHAWPEAIRLPKGKIVSVTHLKYVASDGTLTTLTPATDYSLVNASQTKPGFLLPAYGLSWPGTRAVPNAVQATWVAGYGAAAAVPEVFKQAIKLLLGSLYEHRESEVTGTIATELMHGLKMLLYGERIIELG